MKRIAVFVMAGLFLVFSGLVGCTTLKADFAKVETKVESIDWAAVSDYWTKFDAGLQKAMPVIEALFPGSKSTIDKVVAPVLADSNTAVTTFTTTVAAYKAGTLSATQIQAAAEEVQSSVTAASAVVGQALKGKVGVAAAAAPAKAAAPVPLR
ncbi:MAG: hypothetical protein ACLQBD_26715 [Syntrophobacteraceae bacterium]